MNIEKGTMLIGFPKGDPAFGALAEYMHNREPISLFGRQWRVTKLTYESIHEGNGCFVDLNEIAGDIYKTGGG